MPRWIHPITGQWDSAHRYLHPNAANPERSLSLTVLCQHKVVRVIVEDGIATGIEVLGSPPVNMNMSVAGLQRMSDTTSRTLNHPVLVKVRAKRLVVLSAGSINTPTILERSGIGAADLIEKLGLECIVDLPDVGENYQDHIGTQYFYRVDKETLPLNDAYLRGELKAIQQADEDLKQSKGAHTSNFVVASGKIRLTKEEWGRSFVSCCYGDTPICANMMYLYLDICWFPNNNNSPIPK